MRVLLLIVIAITVNTAAFAVTVTSTGCCTSPVGDITSTITFDVGGGPNTTDPAGYATYSGTFGFNGGTNPGAGGNFLSQSAQTTLITFSQPINYFGLVWGSPDGYNTVRLFNGATQVGSTQTGSGVSGYVNFFAGLGEQFTSVELASTSCCYETDNHSYRLAETGIPEPATYMLALAGIAMLAGRKLIG